MSASSIVAAALLAPLAAALAVVLLRHRPNWREAASLTAAGVLLCLVVSLLPTVVDGARPELRLFELLPGIGIAFRVEPLGLAFALIVALLWPVTTLYAIGYLRAHAEGHQTRFYLFFAVAIAATIGGAFAANLMTLYLFYEALTLATYPLVTHGGDEAARRGGRTYLMLLLGTSMVFLLVAIGGVYVATGTLDFVDGGVLAQNGALRPGVTPGMVALLYALFLFGTGKAALMPFHRWLPAAMVAPTPVSALLHAVAVVKLGVFAILKFSVYTFGSDVLAMPGATLAMQVVAAATLLTAGVLAMRQDNLKRRLAYSTISQLAYIVLAATLANRAGLLAGGMHIAAHALAKITLFFCAGMLLVSLHKTSVSELRGAGRAMPLTLGAWIVASLCVIGIPPTGGFWSKWYLAQGALEAGQPLLLAVVLLGSLLAMGYLLPPALHAFQPADGAPSPATHAGRFEAPASALAALLLTATLSVLLFFAAPPVLALLEGYAGLP